jgi:hypothetical protein
MELTHLLLLEALRYEPDTGHFYWQKMLGKARRGFAGKRAGSDRPNQHYTTISVCGRVYYAHRLAWFYTHGRWPNEHIDHINGDKLDNRLCNLREATRAQNMRNSRRHKDNTSGFTGVRFHRPSGKWQACGSYDHRFRSFGYYDTAEEAAKARELATKATFGEYYPPR